MFNLKGIVEKYQSLTSAEISLHSLRVNPTIWIDEEEVDIFCSYIQEINLITILIDEVIMIARDNNWEPEEVFEYILVHEIGHSLDPELEELNSQLVNNEELSEVKFRAEVNAWKIADTIIPEQTLRYKILRANCLEAYSEGHPEWRDKWCPDYF
ncbi:hypothetical protein H6G33_09675 [Calothrix sp. FACHB-1219]|uniref:hypothetical protein n=1 Tax=unclassified Calothrix TaxID=2619626 RepID=UPI0016884959|nr:MULTISPECIES: hypothetical protein [unclassified Calothrix]MBD2201616.1 hypothetical protein [Calothrix sp. FACHB-168]MBD2217302.1 hypothetical protein [Calothrix sp. FACHB-1219]